jgi:hypothetical protein
MEPLSVLQVIATAVSVAKFLVSKELAVTVKNIRAYFGPKPPPPQFADQQAVNFINLLVIDRELLDILDKQTRDAIIEYGSCLKRAKSAGHRFACDRRAQQDVCETLDRIRQRNAGNLPTDYLDKQWKSFDCSIA